MARSTRKGQSGGAMPWRRVPVNPVDLMDLKDPRRLQVPTPPSLELEPVDPVEANRALSELTKPKEPQIVELPKPPDPQEELNSRISERAGEMRESEPFKKVENFFTGTVEPLVKGAKAVASAITPDDPTKPLNIPQRLLLGPVLAPLTDVVPSLRGAAHGAIQGGVEGSGEVFSPADLATLGTAAAAKGVTSLTRLPKLASSARQLGTLARGTEALADVGTMGVGVTQAGIGAAQGNVQDVLAGGAVAALGGASRLVNNRSNFEQFVPKTRTPHNQELEKKLLEDIFTQSDDVTPLGDVPKTPEINDPSGYRGNTKTTHLIKHSAVVQDMMGWVEQVFNEIRGVVPEVMPEYRQWGKERGHSDILLDIHPVEEVLKETSLKGIVSPIDNFQGLKGQMQVGKNTPNERIVKINPLAFVEQIVRDLSPSKVLDPEGMQAIAPLYAPFVKDKVAAGKELMRRAYSTIAHEIAHAVDLSATHSTPSHDPISGGYGKWDPSPSVTTFTDMGGNRIGDTTIRDAGTWVPSPKTEDVRFRTLHKLIRSYKDGAIFTKMTEGLDDRAASWFTGIVDVIETGRGRPLSSRPPAIEGVPWKAGVAGGGAPGGRGGGPGPVGPPGSPGPVSGGPALNLRHLQPTTVKYVTSFGMNDPMRIEAFRIMVEEKGYGPAFARGFVDDSFKGMSPAKAIAHAQRAPLATPKAPPTGPGTPPPPAPPQPPTTGGPVQPPVQPPTPPPTPPAGAPPPQGTGAPPPAAPPPAWQGPPIPPLAKRKGIGIPSWVNRRKAAGLRGEVTRAKFEDLRRPTDKEGIQQIINYQKDPASIGPRGADVEAFYDQWLVKLRKAGVQVGRKENYITQLWEDPPEVVDKVFGRAAGRRPLFTLERVIENYEEGIKKGLNPKFKQLPDLIGWYEDRARTLLANQLVFNQLRKGKVIKPKSKAPRVDKAGREWVTIDPDRFGTVRYVDQKKHIHEEVWMAPEHVARVINNYLRGPDKTWEKPLKLATDIKNVVMSSGIPFTGANFHGVNILRRIALGQSNPVKGAARAIGSIKGFLSPQKASLRLLDIKKRAIPFVEAGMTLGIEDHPIKPTRELVIKQIAQSAGLRKKLGTALRGTKAEIGETKGIYGKLRKFHEVLFEDPLFQVILPTTKVEFAEEAARWLRQNGYSKKKSRSVAAHWMNDLFGGVNWEERGKDPNFQAFLRIALVAPDWAKTNVNLGVKGLKALKSSSPEMRMYRNVVQNAAAFYLTTTLIQKAFSGKWMHENPEGRDYNVAAGTAAGGKTRYLKPSGTAEDFARIPYEVVSKILRGDLSGLGEVIKNRLHPLTQGTLNVLKNTNFFNRPLTGPPKAGQSKLSHMGAQALNIGKEIGDVAAPAYVSAAMSAVMEKKSPEEVLAKAVEAPVVYQTPRAGTQGKKTPFSSRTRRRRRGLFR